jgi:hypothetical protein
MPTNIVVMPNNVKREFLKPLEALEYFEANNATALLCAKEGCGVSTLPPESNIDMDSIALISGDEVKVAVYVFERYFNSTFRDGSTADECAISIYNKLVGR